MKLKSEQYYTPHYLYKKTVELTDRKRRISNCIRNMQIQLYQHCGTELMYNSDMQLHKEAHHKAQDSGREFNY